MQAVARFFHAGMTEFGGFSAGRVLDFGCGAGALAGSLLELGLDAYGCDIDVLWPDSPRCRLMDSTPYRIPFDDESFDAVVNTGVLEHAKNIEEALHEVRRVLRPGGVSMHLFPSRGYLPAEPYISVPLANFVWPRFPEPYFALWARLGIRGPMQAGLSWRETVEENRRFFQDGVIYTSNLKRDEVARKVFGNCQWPMQFFVEHMPGRGSALFRRLPFKSVSGLLLREFRTAFMVSVR